MVNFLKAPLVHGLLGAGLVAGITNCLNIALMRASGQAVATGISSLDGIVTIGIFWILPNSLWTWFAGILILAVVVELIEKNVQGDIIRLLTIILLVALVRASIAQPNLSAFAIAAAGSFLTAWVIVYIYRARGFAAAMLAAALPAWIQMATVSRHLGDPGFTQQANIITAILLALLAIGFWGYVGNWVIGKFRTIEVG